MEILNFFVTLDDSYDMEVNFYFNRLNNNQYEKSFISIKRDSIYNMDKHRNILFTKKNENSTNWITPGKSFCPLEKVLFEFKFQNWFDIMWVSFIVFFQGHYWMKNFMYDSSVLPSVFPEGHWRMNMDYFHEDKLMIGFRIFFQTVSYDWNNCVWFARFFFTKEKCMSI